MRRVLFICGRNRLRSPTAEAIFSGMSGVEVSSAGTAPDAECQVCADLLAWADDVFVMEQRQKKWLNLKFNKELSGKRLVCLGIADRYQFMQPELATLLREKVLPLLRV